MCLVFSVYGKLVRAILSISCNRLLRGAVADPVIDDRVELFFSP